MGAPVVAKIWWEAPHRGLLERFMVATDAITFGRGGDCSIRLGHAPVYDATVPRLWGEFSWHRGSFVVQNLSSRWGLNLVPAPDSGGGARISIPPGAGGSSPAARFQVVAQAPNVDVTLSVQTAPPRRPDLADGSSADPPSFVPFTLTRTQKLIGAAVIAPLRDGKPRRAGYAEVAAASHYSERSVREAVAAMDGLFIVHALADPSASGDALDRVAQTLRLHTALLDDLR
jgi:hypothetical protein